MGKLGKRPGSRGNYVQDEGPHILSANTETRRLLIVLISLLPPLLAAVTLFPWNAFRVLITVICSVLLIQIPLRDRRNRAGLNDTLRILISGLIYALMLPPNIPVELVFLGLLIVVLYGQVIFEQTASQPFHPALVGIIFLQVSFPMKTTVYLSENLRAVSYHQMLVTGQMHLKDLLTGNFPGALGQTCALAIIASFLILLVLRQIDWRQTVLFAASVALASFLFGFDVTLAVMSGGTLFAAVFLVTDSRSIPMSAKSRMFFAVAAGFLTVCLRSLDFHLYAPGLAILFMSLFTPWFDRWSKPGGSFAG